jgi:hypothetical protein
MTPRLHVIRTCKPVKPEPSPINGTTMSNEQDTGLALGQNLAHLLPPSWKGDVARWFAEDTPSFDWAGFVVGEDEQEAFLWGKSEVGTLTNRLTSGCTSWSTFL